MTRYQPRMNEENYERNSKKQSVMMQELYQASHHDLYNLCIVLGSMLTYRSFEEKGMGSVSEYGEQMTDNLIKMLVGNLKEIRKVEHLNQTNSP